MFLALVCPIAGAQVVSYEALTTFPEDAAPPWTRLGTFDAYRWLQDGWLYQFCELGVWAPPPYGEFDYFRRDIPEFSGQPFYCQWRVQAGIPQSEIDGVPVVVNVGGNQSAGFHFSISDSQVRLIRDNPITLIQYFDFAPGIPHTFRLEIVGSQYKICIDVDQLHTATAAGPYPTTGSRVTWDSGFYNLVNLTRWDYIRYGLIAQDGSGDYDSNNVFDETDTYFFLDCLLTQDGSYPGCRWADMNADGTVNGADITQFAALLANP